MNIRLPLLFAACTAIVGAQIGYAYGYFTGEDDTEAQYKASTRVDCEQLPGKAEQCTTHREYYEGVKP